MAAAIIPLVAGVAPELINLIVSLVHRHAPAAEQQSGSGTGPVKFAEVLTQVMAALQNAANAGAISGPLPSQDLIKLIIQAVVSSMKAIGLLNSSAPTLIPDAAASATAKQIVLHAGDTLAITVTS